MDLINVLLTPAVLALSAGIVAILWGAGQIPVQGDKRLRQLPWWRRILPVLSLVLGAAGAFLPGVVAGPDGDPLAWGSKILAGVWAGFVAAHGRKVLLRAAGLDTMAAK